METELQQEQKPQQADIIIVGGAYVGLSLAAAVKEACPHLDIVVLDAAEDGAWKHDLRASALAAAGVRMLDQLGVWQAIVPQAEAIREMIVTDSRVADPVRPVFLTFAGDVKPCEPFAYMVENRHLSAALHDRLAELGVRIIAGAKAQQLQMLYKNRQSGQRNAVRVTLAGGDIWEGRLLVAADGAHSLMRKQAGIKVFRREYNQWGIVCNVAHEKPHNGRAEEHFLPAGPFAILPLKGNRSSLVWNETPEKAQYLLAADDSVFAAELERRFGRHLGALHLEGGRCGFPFGVQMAREFARDGIALVGDSAHGVHPITGQGLNLGLRDAAALAEVLAEAERLGQEINSFSVLERYQTWRRFETFRMCAVTDTLNRLFSNDCAPVRLMRDFGLGLVDKMPFLKSYFIKEAAGIIHGSPRLLLGQPL